MSARRFRDEKRRILIAMVAELEQLIQGLRDEDPLDIERAREWLHEATDEAGPNELWLMCSGIGDALQKLHERTTRLVGE